MKPTHLKTLMCFAGITLFALIRAHTHTCIHMHNIAALHTMVQCINNTSQEDMLIIYALAHFIVPFNRHTLSNERALSYALIIIVGVPTPKEAALMHIHVCECMCVLTLKILFMIAS